MYQDPHIKCGSGSKDSKNADAMRIRIRNPFELGLEPDNANFNILWNVQGDFRRLGRAMWQCCPRRGVPDHRRKSLSNQDLRCFPVRIFL